MATRKGSMAEVEVEETEEVVEETVEEEEITPATELWEGGPTKAMVDAWKAEHGDIYVTSVSLDKHFVWRTLTRFEYRRLVKNLEQQVASGQVTQAEANMNNEESIAEMCIIYPAVTRAQLAGEMAGISSIIAQEVMEASAFVAVEVRQL